MRIDVYDFDGTIYDGDSTVDFTRFCLRRHPGVLAGLPKFLGTSLLLAAGRRSLTQFKSVLFGEMARRFNLETEAELFWQAEATRAKLGKWFFDRPRDLPIVIASASPEFELQYAAKLLGVPTLIGTKCDVKTGALIGKNCKGEEKLRRIEQNIGRLKSAPCIPTTLSGRPAARRCPGGIYCHPRRACAVSGIKRRVSDEENAEYERLFCRRRHPV